MRNLLEFPVTKEEKMDFLAKLYDKEKRKAIVNYGDMTCIIITEIMKDLKKLAGQA